MIPLKKHFVEFWGQRSLCRPMLLRAIFGTGAEWIWFEYMDDRPDYYVIRVPFGTHKLIDDRSNGWYDDLMPDIENTIQDEAMEYYTERQYRELDKKGYISETRIWPIPPESPSGSSWGRYNPSEELLNTYGSVASPRKRTRAAMTKGRKIGSQ